MEESSDKKQMKKEDIISDEVEEKNVDADVNSSVTDKKSYDNGLKSEVDLKLTGSISASNTEVQNGDIKSIPDDEESFTEIAEDGWEDILGSGRLRKRIIKEGKKGLASEGLGRPSRNDNVTISLKGICIKVTSKIGRI